MPDQLFIQRRFTIQKDDISLSDALIIPKEEYEALSEQEIETLKTERFDNHKYRLEHPPQVVEPTKEEKLEALNTELTELQRKFSEVEGKEITISKSDAVIEEVVKEGK